LYNILKDILVPVDLGNTTPFIIRQAIELSGIDDTTIHLLHVYKPGSKSGKVPSEEDDPGRMDAVTKLEQWRACLQEAIPASKVKGYLLKGMVQQCILDVARNIKPQLIIMGKPARTNRFSFYKSLSADEISQSSKCPVLSVSHNDTPNKLKTIVLPVRDFIPLRKMELLAIFAKIYRARIFIVAMQNRIFMNAKEKQVLLETYRVLLNGLNNKVEYLLLSGNNFTRAVAAYAEETGADMLIVNPKKETRVPGFFKTDINDILPADSRLKILSIVPYHDL
jgi:nucleotide-binding universal stress UspA family protein